MVLILKLSEKLVRVKKRSSTKKRKNKTPEASVPSKKKEQNMEGADKQVGTNKGDTKHLDLSNDDESEFNIMFWVSIYIASYC